MSKFEQNQQEMHVGPHCSSDSEAIWNKIAHSSICVVCYWYQNVIVSMAQNKIWENPKVLKFFSLPMNVPLWFYSNENSASEGACILHLPFMNGGGCGDNESSEVRCLTKNVWRLNKGQKFRLCDSVEDALDNITCNSM